MTNPFNKANGTSLVDVYLWMVGQKSNRFLENGDVSHMNPMVRSKKSSWTSSFILFLVFLSGAYSQGGKWNPNNTHNMLMAVIWAWSSFYLLSPYLAEKTYVPALPSAGFFSPSTRSIVLAFWQSNNSSWYTPETLRVEPENTPNGKGETFKNPPISGFQPLVLWDKKTFNLTPLGSFGESPPRNRRFSETADFMRKESTWKIKHHSLPRI